MNKLTKYLIIQNKETCKENYNNPGYPYPNFLIYFKASKNVSSSTSYLLISEAYDARFTSAAVAKVLNVLF